MSEEKSEHQNILPGEGVRAMRGLSHEVPGYTRSLRKPDYQPEQLLSAGWLSGTAGSSVFRYGTIRVVSVGSAT